VVGTDGLFNYVSYESIAATARAEESPHAIAKRLASLARTPSGTYQDDLGVVVVRFALPFVPLAELRLGIEGSCGCEASGSGSRRASGGARFTSG
jgi:hypothetical protein